MRTAQVLWLSSCLVLGAYGAGCASDPDKGDDDGASSGSGGKPSDDATSGSGGSSSPGSGGKAAGSGGASASGAMADCDALKLPENEDDVIATFEDGVGNVVQTETRGGGFYMYNDGTGTQMPPVGKLPDARREARCKSAFALCMKGTGFTDWGAGMGTDLGRVAPLDAGMVVDAGMIADGGMPMKAPYDASEYKGISFWAKSNGMPVLMRVNFKDKNTAPEGGVCDASAESGATACNDDWGKNINLTTSWAPYTILFSEIKQSGWGAAYKAFDIENAYAMQFQVNKGIDFDLCIDDLAFVR